MQLLRQAPWGAEGLETAAHLSAVRDDAAVSRHLVNRSLDVVSGDARSPLRGSAKPRSGPACWASILLRVGGVTLRITVEETGLRRIVRVEGRLTLEQIPELEGALGDDLNNTEIQLENLRSADPAGLAALRRLRAAGAALCAVPPRFAFEI